MKYGFIGCGNMGGEERQINILTQNCNYFHKYRLQMQRNKLE